MTTPQPSQTAMPERLQRHDGITPDRERLFLETLAATGSITDAAATIGISRAALYRMRKHDADFSRRWTEALKDAVAVLADDAFERAVKGTSEPVWYKGEQIGERVRYNDRMVMFLLRSHDPKTYGRPEEPRAARSPRPTAILPPRPAERDAQPRISPALVSTLSTSPAGVEEELIDEDIDDETFRAELRAYRGGEIPTSFGKRAARRRAAKARLKAGVG